VNCKIVHPPQECYAVVIPVEYLGDDVRKNPWEGEGLHSGFYDHPLFLPPFSIGHFNEVETRWKSGKI